MGTWQATLVLPNGNKSHHQACKFCFCSYVWINIKLFMGFYVGIWHDYFKM
jgi:hypothetical protein